MPILSFVVIFYILGSTSAAGCTIPHTGWCIRTADTFNPFFTFLINISNCCSKNNENDQTNYKICHDKTPILLIGT